MSLVYLIVQTEYKHANEVSSELYKNPHGYEVDRLLEEDYDELLKPYHTKKG